LIEIGESREEFYKGKITGASASTGTGPRSRFKKVSDGVRRCVSGEGEARTILLLGFYQILILSARSLCLKKLLGIFSTAISSSLKTPLKSLKQRRLTNLMFMTLNLARFFLNVESRILER